MCQGEDAEFVKHIWNVGDGRKQPVEVVLVDTLGEEGNDSKKASGVRAKVLERRGGKRKFDRGGEAPGVPCVKHPRSPSIPFPTQSVGVPFTVLGDSSEQGDREGVEVQLLQDVIDQIGSFAMLVDAIECVTCSLHRQCWDIESLAVRRDGGDTGGDAKTNVVEPTQFVHNGIDLLPARPLQIENGFGIVEGDEHLL